MKAAPVVYFEVATERPAVENHVVLRQSVYRILTSIMVMPPISVRVPAARSRSGLALTLLVCPLALVL